MIEPTIEELSLFALGVNTALGGACGIKVDRINLAKLGPLNKDAYFQYIAECHMLIGTITIETWFTDSLRRGFGWPQVIRNDYIRYYGQRGIQWRRIKNWLTSQTRLMSRSQKQAQSAT